MKRLAIILMALGLVQPHCLLAQNQNINGSLTVSGSIQGISALSAKNPSNTSANLLLSWHNHVARIRIGGSGTGAGNGLDIQTLGDRSLMRLLNNGNVGIGTASPDSRLTVNGNIRAKELKLEATNWPDFVFSSHYDLMPLDKVKEEIKAKGHLPGLAPALQYEKEGIPMAEMTRILVQKVEELTLYLIECEEKIGMLEKQVILLQGNKTGDPD